jgi:hypothetical protein
VSNLKIEVARLQLGTAMDLYLRGLDPVSVHCLASGACEVIEFYAQKLSGKALLTGFVETKPDVSFVDLRNSQRQYWNSFKHATMPYQKGKQTAERDDDKLLKTFRDEKNDLALLIGWYDYHLATRKMPIEAQTQQAWYFALHPEKLDPKTARIYEKFFPNLRTKPRAEQKRMLNDVIERVRVDNDYMSHPITEHRPLVLSWPVAAG